MATLKASQLGLAKIKQARNQKGWAVSDFRWIESASAVLGKSWAQDGTLAVGISEGTWKRFLAGKHPINTEAFQAYCQILGLDWQEIAEPIPESPLPSPPLLPAPLPPASSPSSHHLPAPVRLSAHVEACPPASSPPAPLQTDWGNAPDVTIFYGRQEELHTVRQWILQEHCRLITLLGMGGIGKTSLSVKLATEIIHPAPCSLPPATLPSTPFQFLIWRSLRNTPSIDDLLTDLIQFLSQQQETQLPTPLEGKITKLLSHLRAARCLLILDNAESILLAGDRTGRYRPGYEGYGEFLHCVAETRHQSCLILTSREKPQGLARFEGENLPVRSLQLSGLPEPDSRELFNLKGQFTATETEWQTLISRYAGNPLALKIVASSVRDYFDGDISYFLDTTRQSPFLFDDIRDLLDQQFQRLTDLERSIMYWLAIDREPVTLPELQADFITPIPHRELMESLNSLQRRSLIEKSHTTYTQQPVVMEYVTTQLIEQVGEEIRETEGRRRKTEETQDDSKIQNQELIQNLKSKIQNPNCSLFITHTLLKATAKDYVRETEINLIVKPLIDRLITELGSIQTVVEILNDLLSELRGKPAKETGYAAGNTLNLLRHAGMDLSNFDASQLTVWQADLQGVPLHGVDFSHSELSRCVFTETLGNSLSAAFSPDGRLLATCDTDCQVRLWEVPSGRLLRICRGHANWVRFVAFSRDGKTLASCGADCTVRLWNVEDGVCIKTFVGHHHELFAVAFSPDGQWLASAGGDRTVKLWNIRDGDCLKTFLGHTDWVRTVAFSPDGTILASGSADHTLKLWDVETATCLRTLTEHSGWVRSIAFKPIADPSLDPDRILASGSSDRTLKLWDYSTGTCLRTYTGHKGSIYSIAFSPAGDLIASGSGDRTVKFWDSHTDQCLKTLHGQTNEVCSVALSVDDQTLACLSLDQTMRLWNYRSGHCLKTWSGNTDWALPVTFSPDGEILASGSNDQTIKLWNWQTGQCLRTLQGHQDFIYGLAFSPDGKTLASASTDLTVRLWQVKTGQCRQILQGHTDWVNVVIFHPQESQVVSGSADATIKIWNPHTGQCLKTLTGHTDKILGLAFTPDGQFLASGSGDQTVRVWNPMTGECLKVLKGHENRVYAIAFQPTSNNLSTGNLLASCSNDRTLKFWDWQTGTCINTLIGHTNWVFGLAFSPDGNTLVSAAHDHTLRIWEVETGTCRQVCTGHTHLVSSVAFCPTGQAIASGSQDQTVRIWHPNTGNCDRILIAERLYEGMNLTGVKGLTPATISTLQTLGALG